MKIISWNVNGIRAVEKKGFIKWLEKENPDILGLQEIKAMEDQLSKELLAPHGYHTYFNPAQRKGYSGTALYSKIQPGEVYNGFGIPEFDSEGRIQAAEYGDFTFFNIYFPNGKQSTERLEYKLNFYDAALDHFEELVKKGKKLIITGDYNTAHHEVDLARPKENETISGFLPVERKWLDKITEHGYIDCFRMFNQEPNNYTWWSMRAGARPRNVGWRIDYFFCSKNTKPLIKNCYHLPEVMGSDHCPIVLEI
ncbi:exodeoxyribonuclease III [Candidatus Peregrinibacteria bacterium]|nr:exodeoxyribonuclease III [Candidatus Peregrinibacteria bacterium]